MEKFFQKYNWAINFVLIGTAMLLAALMINNFVAAQLADLTVPEMPSFDEMDADRDRDQIEEAERDQWVASLTDRCLFGCPEEEDPDECPDGCPDGEVCEEGECVPEEPEEDPEDELDFPEPTELDVTLTGVLAAQNPQWSMAMIESADTDQTHALGVGDALPVDQPVEILEIRRDRVFIDNDGSLEFIRLEDSPYPDPGQIDPRDRQPDRDDSRDRGGDRGQDGGDESADGGLATRRGEGVYAVDRDRIEAELEDPEALQEEARIMPNYTDGEADGLRLVGVTPDSLYSELGIQSGDVLQTVDGDEVTSQREARQMLESMRGEDEVTIEIERRGQRQDITYRMR